MGLRLIKLNSPTIIGRRTALGWQRTSAKPYFAAKPLLNKTGMELLKELVTDDQGGPMPWRAITILLMAASGTWLAGAEAASLLSLVPSHSHEVIDRIRDRAPRLAAETLSVAVFTELMNIIWEWSIKD